MKLNYLVVFYKDLENGDIEVKHECAYTEHPSDLDIEELIEEIGTDEEFGMVGDTDYEVMVFKREDWNATIIDHQIPAEI